MIASHKAVAVVVAGGVLGALARFVAVSAGGVWAVLAVNAVGCVLIGMLAGLVASGTLLRLFLGTGVLGGFTTFSAYAVDGLRFAGSGRPLETVLYLGGTVVSALAGVWLGGALAVAAVTALVVALGAPIGAPARYLVDVALRRRLGAAFPWGTLCVNVIGSFVLGLVVGAEPGARLVALLGTGFCGAFTTYSAFALDTVSLPRGRAVLNVVANVALGLGAAALGLALG